MADCPEDTATPAFAPSRSAIRRSSAATVGLEPRE